MRTTAILLLTTMLIACNKKASDNITQQPPQIGTSAADTVILQPTTPIYYDSLLTVYDGASKSINDDKQEYEDGLDQLTVLIMKNASKNTYTFDVSCKRLTASFTLPDSLKNSARVVLTQQQQGYSETLWLDFTNGQEPEIKISQNWPIAQGSNYKNFYSFK